MGWIQSGTGDWNAFELTGCDAFFPQRRAGDVRTGAACIDGHGDWHVNHVEFVNGFHAQIGKTHHFCVLNGFTDQVGGATDGHEVGTLVFFDSFNGDRAALGFADH